MSPRNLQTLTATYPDLWDQPELAMELANSPLPTTQMLSQSLSAIGTIEAQKKINFTRLLPDAEQERWWNSLNASQQDVYRTLGYDRGNQASSEPSITDFWKGGGVSGAIGGVLSTVGRGIGQSVDLVVPDQVSTAITSGVGDALHALTVIGDTAPHLYRTAVAVGEDFGIQGDQSFFDGLAAMGGTLVKTVTDPGRVVEAFLETGSGNASTPRPPRTQPSNSSTVTSKPWRSHSNCQGDQT